MTQWQDPLLSCWVVVQLKLLLHWIFSSLIIIFHFQGYLGIWYYEGHLSGVCTVSTCVEPDHGRRGESRGRRNRINIWATSSCFKPWPAGQKSEDGTLALMATFKTLLPTKGSTLRDGAVALTAIFMTLLRSRSCLLFHRLTTLVILSEEPRNSLQDPILRKLM